ncbi:MAG: hypothetical protein H6Q34_845, partial [Deltaproteobacteria bacterium]|nr:hypothetical protein [Deltaproteobacteria bacterium]
MVITRVAPVSCAKVAGLLYFLIGLVVGALISVAALVGVFSAIPAQRGAFGAVFGVGAVVLLPICYGALGFVMTLIGAGLFNMATAIVGGIEVDAK